MPSVYGISHRFLTFRRATHPCSGAYKGTCHPNNSYTMKSARIFLIWLVSVLAFFFVHPAAGQDTIPRAAERVQKIYIVIKNDGTEFIGYILSQDEREVLMDTESIGRVVIPKHEIREIREVQTREMRDGVYVGSNIFSSRYFINTNGLSIKKGENYALINWYGPESHFCLADNFTLGGLTSWLGVPIIISAKYSIPVTDNLHFGLGVLAGTLSWYDFGSVGALGYASVTLGNNNNNLTFSAGYAGITNGDDVSGSEPLFSVAGMVRLGRNVSLVGDSFIYAGPNAAALIIPGLRFSRNERKAFQFGFAGAVIEGELVPFPIPMLSWFLKI